MHGPTSQSAEAHGPLASEAMREAALRSCGPLLWLWLCQWLPCRWPCGRAAIFWPPVAIRSCQQRLRGCNCSIAPKDGCRRTESAFTGRHTSSVGAAISAAVGAAFFASVGAAYSLTVEPPPTGRLQSLTVAGAAVWSPGPLGEGQRPLGGLQAPPVVRSHQHEQHAGQGHSEPHPAQTGCLLLSLGRIGLRDRGIGSRNRWTRVHWRDHGLHQRRDCCANRGRDCG
mmetsp:Transcript_11007/g.25873  ORF Transcript_11007/g.25873 Transcript_11007/m.25873 type:complete len:227 (-) Transcript_11007:66-746(-)